MTDAQHKDQWGRPITIDHIDRNRARSVMDNLQTLCLVCHSRKDIVQELHTPRVPAYQEKIIQWRADGATYQAIADELGFSIGAIWKWVQRWKEEYLCRMT
jgi:DNA-directed RNA polymerase specialized sigma24 family protein